jgi:hypothetical protein
MTITGNVISHAPHNGMLGGGNNNLFIGNTFDTLCFEVSDSGAWYPPATAAATDFRAFFIFARLYFRAFFCLLASQRRISGTPVAPGFKEGTSS